MRFRQALLRLAVVLSAVGSLALGSGLAASAGGGPLAGTASRQATAGIYMNFDGISGESTTSGFQDWIGVLS